jgi:hypothetical protein
MKVITIGRALTETKTTYLAILPDQANPTGFVPRRYCLDNRPGKNECREVLHGGGIPIVNFTVADDCQSSPGHFAKCF